MTQPLGVASDSQMNGRGSCKKTESRLSASYKTFDMVCKILENGSVKKQFFERYGNNLSQILKNEREQVSTIKSFDTNIIDHSAEAKEARNRNMPNYQALNGDKFIKKKKVLATASTLP